MFDMGIGLHVRAHQHRRQLEVDRIHKADVRKRRIGNCDHGDPGCSHRQSCNHPLHAAYIDTDAGLQKPDLEAKRPTEAEQNQPEPAGRGERYCGEIGAARQLQTHVYLAAICLSDILWGDCDLAIACRRRTTSAYRMLSAFLVSKERFLLNRRNFKMATRAGLLKTSQI
jgi:hypothetical protein